MLIDKLACLGFHSTLLQWLKSYLNRRRCVVTLDDVQSEPFFATSGVPQGSILGPLLFILFINDIGSCFSFANFLLYADDLKIYSVVRNTTDMMKLQSELDELYSWCLRSHLSLNIKKCVHVSFSKSRNLFKTQYSFSGSTLQSLQEFKDLGVIFDIKFSFITHINFVISKAYAMLGFVRRNSTEFSDPYTIKLLYTSFVRSHLEYAAIIWRPFHQFHIDRIERVQKVFLKFALRSLGFSDPIPSYSARLALLNLKSLDKRRSILSLTFIFCIIQGVYDCQSLLERINFNVPRRYLRASLPFYADNARTNYARNAPIGRAICEFNQISTSVDLDFSLPKTVFTNILNSMS